MYGTPITVTGNVVDEVMLKTTEGGLPRVSFRVASTARRKDRDTGQWVDGHKFFVNVTFWRDFAENVASSVNKGDPIIVTGRIYSKQYIKDEVSRVSYEIEPDSLGHDLSRGQSVFSRRKRAQGQDVALDANGLPEQPDETDYELDDDSQVYEAASSEATDLSAARPLVATG